MFQAGTRANPDRLEQLEQAIERLTRQQEAMLGQIGTRLDSLAHARTAYLGDHTALSFLESGHRIYVDTRDVGIGSHLLTLGRWEPQYTAVFQRLIMPGDTVFDIGANHGVYSLLGAAAAGPFGHVHGFEANPHLARLAAQSVSINGYGGQATIHAVAVGAAAGVARLVFDRAWSGGGSLFGTPAEPGPAEAAQAIACPMVALDEMFPDPGFEAQVMKMDVEGAEGLALRGMQGLLARSPRLRLLMEFCPAMLTASGVPAAEVVGMLQAEGFRAWTVTDQATLRPVEWTALVAAPGLQNIVACRQTLD